MTDLDRVTGLFRLAKVLLSLVCATICAVVTLSVWLSKKAVALQRVEIHEEILQQQEYQLNTVLKRLAVNDEAHLEIRRELDRVHDDVRETRTTIVEIFEGGKLHGLWGNPGYDSASHKP